MSIAFRIAPAGDFSLAASIDFLAGFTPIGYLQKGADPGAGDDVLRLAFGVERHPISAGVAVRQGSSGVVLAEVDDVAGGSESQIDHDVLRGQIARILSLDVDATGLETALGRDQQARELLARLPGLRPVCFASPYEAAAWAVLSQRVQRVQAARTRLRIAQELGTQHVVAGQPVAAFPRPEVLQDAAGLTGLTPEVKVHRLRAVAQAALDGVLDGERLRAMDPDDAIAALCAIDGIGPFSAELILVRGAGHPDRFPQHEGRLHQEMSAVYGVPKDDVAQLALIAQRWAPFRSWVSFFYRSQAGQRPGRPAGTSSRSSQRR